MVFSYETEKQNLWFSVMRLKNKKLMVFRYETENRSVENVFFCSPRRNSSQFVNVKLIHEKANSNVEGSRKQTVSRLLSASFHN